MKINIQILAICLLLPVIGWSQSKELLERAKAGDVEAEVQAAHAYSANHNWKKAAEWYEKAERQGNAEAAYQLGIEYWLGMLPQTRGLLRIPQPDVNYNVGMARIHILKAAMAGYGPACGWMGYYYEKGYAVIQPDAVTTSSGDMRVSPSYGGGVSAHGSTREETRFGSGPDYAEAILWYRKAAEQNDAISEYSLGRFYEQGLGVKQNPTLALSWYKRAAGHGNADARTRYELLSEEMSTPK
jgi:TPR repeat protein